MSKTSEIKYLKLTKARNEHFCNKCGNKINMGEVYYSERLKDRFLHSLHLKKFCNSCYAKFGDGLL